MNASINNYLLWLIPLGVSGYTLSYAWWLWRKKNRFGALGVGILAVLAALYPGVVLFIINI